LSDIAQEIETKRSLRFFHLKFNPMRKLLVVLMTILLATITYAQEQQRDRDRDRLKDHVMLKDGKVIRFQNGEELQLQEQIQLRNGISVNPDGSYRLRNEKMLRLREGECMDMDGKRYRDREQFEKRMNMLEKRQMQREGQKREKPNSGKRKGNS